MAIRDYRNLDEIMDTIEESENEAQRLKEKLKEKREGRFKRLIHVIRKENDQYKLYRKKLKGKIKENIDTIDELEDKIDEAVAQLEQINSKTVTIDQLKEMFGPMFDQIIAQLGDISDGQIDIDKIIEIAESMKPDLTVTNALLETINTTIQNKNFVIIA